LQGNVFFLPHIAYSDNVSIQSLRQQRFEPQGHPRNMSFGQRRGAGRGASGRSQAQPADPLLGRQIEKYILEQRIGVGGSGAVYRARHASLNRAFAVKVLRADLLTDQESRDRFKREVDVLAELNHPNIVSLVDAGYEEGVGPYMIMEWLEGTTLFAERRRRQQLELDEVVGLLDQLTDALSFIHRRGLIHRDLKPENIMLLEATGDNPDDLSKRRLKVFDFGIVLDEEDDNRLTAAGMVVGTPHYMAPEQILIDADVDYRADLYAAGAILFELLAGRPPFGDQQQPLEVMKRHVSKSPPLLQEVAPHRPFPPGAQEVVSRSLAKKPGERFQDARELFDALNQVVSASLAPVSPIPPLVAPEPEPDPNAHLYEATRQIESPFSVEDFARAAEQAQAPVSPHTIPTPQPPPVPPSSPFSPASSAPATAPSPFVAASSPFAPNPSPAFTPVTSPSASSPAIPVVTATGSAPAWGAATGGDSFEEEATRIDVTVPPDLLASLHAAPSGQEEQVQEYADALLAPAPAPVGMGEMPESLQSPQYAPPPPPPIPASSPLRPPAPSSVSVQEMTPDAEFVAATPETPMPPTVSEKPSSPSKKKRKKKKAAAKKEETKSPKKKGKAKILVIGAVVSLLLGALAFLILQFLQR
jgi:serine/threonine protein kinase